MSHDLRKLWGRRVYAKLRPLEVHCQLSDDPDVLCGGRAIPCVPYETFIYLGELKARVPKDAPPSHKPWQRCPICVAMIDGAIDRLKKVAALSEVS